MKVPKTFFYKTRPFREKIGKKKVFKKIVFLVPYVGRKTAASGPSGEWTSSDDTRVDGHKRMLIEKNGVNPSTIVSTGWIFSFNLGISSVVLLIFHVAVYSA